MYLVSIHLFLVETLNTESNPYFSFSFLFENYNPYLLNILFFFCFCFKFPFSSLLNNQ